MINKRIADTEKVKDLFNNYILFSKFGLNTDFLVDIYNKDFTDEEKEQFMAGVQFLKETVSRVK